MVFLYYRIFKVNIIIILSTMYHHGFLILHDIHGKHYHPFIYPISSWLGLVNISHRRFQSIEHP